jgi:hypothetical protein
MSAAERNEVAKHLRDEATKLQSATEYSDGSLPQTLDARTLEGHYELVRQLNLKLLTST